jgi:hypothetical protein
MKADLSRSGGRDYFVKKIMNISRPETNKISLHWKKKSFKYGTYEKEQSASVADPGCLSRILNFSIQGQKDLQIAKPYQH